MSMEMQYTRIATCYTGEVDKFGFAFVPGSGAGIVLMDKRSRALLDNLSIYDATNGDSDRLSLLFGNGLIRKIDSKAIKPRLCNDHIKSISTWLHITNNCNLNCSYCYIRKGTGRMTIPIAEAYLDKLVETVAKHSIRSVAIKMAGGEPTLERSIVEYVVRGLYSRFRDSVDEILPVIITNGTFLDENWIDFINKNSIRVCFSLDGLGYWHDQSRFFKNGEGSYEMVFKNLKLCLSSGLKPTVLTTITENNIDGIEKLNQYLIDNDLNFRYGIYRDTVGNYDGYQTFIDKLRAVLNRCYDYYARAIIEKRAQFRHQLADIRIDRNRHLRCCGIGHSVVTVNHEGRVYLCQSRMNFKPIGDIWEKRTLLEMAHSQNALPQLADHCVLDYNFCKSCQWALTCGGGCPVVNADTFGTPLTASPYCELFKMMIPKLVYLKALSLAVSIKK